MSHQQNLQKLSAKIREGLAMRANIFVCSAVILLVSAATDYHAAAEDGLSQEEWQEFASPVGNFQVLLPGHASYFEKIEPLEGFGDAERHICVTVLKRGEAVASFLATSAREPQAYLDKFTAKQRIERLLNATATDARNNFPNATIEVRREVRDERNYQTVFWKVTVKGPATWLEVQTIAFYVNDTFYAAEVVHFSRGAARATRQADIDRFLSSFGLFSKEKSTLLAKRTM